MTADQQRAAADYLGERYRVSQRRAGRVLGRARSTLRRRPRPRDGEAALVGAIKRLARRHPRYGYRRVHALLVRGGWSLNLKRVRRLWRALGLRRPVRFRNGRNKLGPKRGSSANSCVNRPARFRNDVWTVDFIADRTADGKALKWLSAVDEDTREGLLLHAAAALQGGDVRRRLGRVAVRRGWPRRLRSDNGGEFVGEAVAGWLPAGGAEGLAVAAGKPWENGYVESFHSRLRDEFLAREVFETPEDARAKGRWWRREYNRVRPHSSLGYKTPREFGDECERGRHGQPPEGKMTKEML